MFVVGAEKHMEYVGKGDDRIVLKALAEYITIHEAKLSTEPEFWEHVVYAGKLHSEIVDLCIVRDNGKLRELRDVNYPFCPHTMGMLNEVMIGTMVCIANISCRLWVCGRATEV